MSSRDRKMSDVARFESLNAVSCNLRNYEKLLQERETPYLSLRLAYFDCYDLTAGKKYFYSTRDYLSIRE